MKRLALILLLFFVIPTFAFAQDVDDLRDRIEGHNGTIGELEQEIEKYKKDIEVLGKEKQSLNSTIRTLDTSRKKLSTEIQVTENRINAAALTVQEIGIEIVSTQKNIDQHKLSIVKTLRNINEAEGESVVEILLRYEDVGQFFNEIDEMKQFQTGVRESTESLIAFREDLEEKRGTQQNKRKELSGFRIDLSGQRRAVEANKSDKESLLKKTQSKESEFKSILEEKKRKKEEFERELLEFESQLSIILDPDAIPPAGKGILAWPLNTVKITQTFGDTAFALGGAYNGKGHNGVDFGVAPGSRVKAAGEGNVVGTGNTDLTCPNASFGKWILLEHPTGLSTLYAHLSAINVSPGQGIERGETIGYSGNTGYSTGPHLHFSVYASQGVEIRKLRSRVCGKDYTLPLADLKAYLDPLSYL